MPDLKLAKLPDRTPVKLTLVITPDLHQALCDYAEVYRDAYGQEETVADLVPSMLQAFLDSDRGLPRRGKPRGHGDIVAVARETGSDSAQPSDTGSAVCVRVDRAMRMLDIGKTKLYELIGAGELETIHIGRRTLVLQESIDAMIQRLRQVPAEDPDSVA
jgi:hypothetical protein